MESWSNAGGREYTDAGGRERLDLYRSEHNYENLGNAAYFGEGKWGIPRIFPFSESGEKRDVALTDFIGFNFAKGCKEPQDKGVHFFLEDYQFLRLWTKPEGYIDLLKKFKCVLSPDFSMYTDFPRATQIYNHYRKHWLAAYWQEMGIKVIPTISWSDEASFEWCFDGEPQNCPVAVSSVGTQKNGEARKLFLLGYNEMLTRLEPSVVLFYGSVPEECDGENVVRIKAFQEGLRERTAKEE